MDKRRSIPSIIKRELYVKSGNRCSICRNTLYTDTDSWIGEVAHIEAVNPGGARYNPMLSTEQVNSFDNLILVCCNCHKEIDSNPMMYTVEYLKNLKHESECLVKKLLQSGLYTDTDMLFVKRIKPTLVNIINIIRYLDIHGGFYTRIIEDIDTLMMSFEEQYYYLSNSLRDALSIICKCTDELEWIIMKNTKAHPSNAYIAYAYKDISEDEEELVLYLRNKLTNDIDALLRNIS